MAQDNRIFQSRTDVIKSDPSLGKSGVFEICRSSEKANVMMVSFELFSPAVSGAEQVLCSQMAELDLQKPVHRQP